MRLGLDIGSTTIKCTLINNEGKMVNQSGREEIGLRRKKNRY